ncbi:MAG TPA: ABC transporter permease, partial [Chitinophagaceae bacterium]|nr:ABC transporter permease [Chitinophagaceae bacterium]
KALWAITRASFKAIFNQPTAVVFSLLFPIIFILIFGAFGSGGVPTYRITLAPGTDTNTVFYKTMMAGGRFKVQQYADTTVRNKDMAKGRLAAIIGINETKDSAGQSFYSISIRSTSANDDKIGAVQEALRGIGLRLDYERLLADTKDKQSHVTIGQLQRTEVRKYRQIDFVLPGQLGFSILFSTLFGIAFTFYTLREQLVLKRFYASPVNRIHILLGIGMSRLFFQLMNVVILILFGHFFLNFTLQHGALTFIEMLLVSIIMLFLLMGVGLIFSSIVKTDASIPLLINLFGFPQMLLSGTFFPIEVFPKWLQSICQFLPLTQFNNAVRKISFEGLSILDCYKEIGILAIWMLVIYAILAKVIRWQ